MSTAQAAALFGVEARQVARWHEAGCPKLGPGVVDLVAVHRWWRDNIAGGKGGKAMEAAKLQYWEAKAEEQAVNASVASGRAWPVERIARECVERAAAFTSAARAMESRLPPFLVGKTELEMRPIIRREVDAALEDYVRPGKDWPVDQGQGKPKGRAKKRVARVSERRGRKRKGSGEASDDA